MIHRPSARQCLLACALGAALNPLAWAQGPQQMAVAAPPAAVLPTIASPSPSPTPSLAPSIAPLGAAATSSAVSPLVNLPPKPGAPGAQRPTPNPGLFDVAAAELRWRSSLAAFAEQDRVAQPQPGGVLFVGSSSIRLWDKLEAAFQQQPVVIKRGFGGSRLADCVAFLDKLVLPYQARQVVLYAGENDLDEGATPAEVLLRYERFVQHLLRAAPATRIAFVSIKPSPARASQLAAIQTTNRLIQAYSEGHPQLDYIDVHSAMLDEAGRPRAELFGQDRLHLNPSGYAIWRDLIAARLKL